MISTVWSGAGNASDIFLLIAAIVAAVDAAVMLAKRAAEAALLPVAVAFVALGLLAV